MHDISFTIDESAHNLRLISLFYTKYTCNMHLENLNQYRHFTLIRLKTVAVKPHTFQVEGRSALLQYFNYSRNWELL